ncbi:MAG: glycerol-3-phosphate dehydrogenase [Candidatus Nanopelagicales bacterium]
MQDNRTDADIIVVGAGINGLGIAADAAARGLTVVVLEKDDLCSGVSAWSGRLVHGGLRYLEHYDFALVRESLKERERLFRNAPHLVKPVRLLMPQFKHNRRPSWLIRLGMIAYDVLSFDKKTARHEVLSLKETLRRFPGIAQDGLTGSFVFTDGQVEYAERLCVEVALQAVRSGAVIRTKAKVDRAVIEGGRVVGVGFTDTRTGEQGEVRAPVVLNVAGPWIDRILGPEAPQQPRLNGGTKGSHLIVDRFPGSPTDVVYYESRSDGRLVLVIPWMGRYLIGTTDRRFDDDPDGARCDADELEYLLTEVNELVPDAHLTPDDVLFTYSGVRPLPYAPDVSEWEVPRSHVLHDHAPSLPGLVTVVGGKLTTYRQLAEDAVDDAFRRLGRTAPPCGTKDRALPGAVADSSALVARLMSGGVSERTAYRLVALYGSRAEAVVDLGCKDPSLLSVLHEPTGALEAELVLAVREELATTLTDVLARRLLLAFEPGHGYESVDRAVTRLSDLLGWDEAEQQAQIVEYRAWVDRLSVPLAVHAGSASSLESPA